MTQLYATGTLTATAPPADRDGIHVGGYGATTKPVGGKMYDMSGNVYHWIWDVWDGSTGYNNGSGGPVTDPIYNGQAWISGFGHVVHGGCWSSTAFYASIAYRTYDYPYSYNSHYGFRVVRP